MQIRSIGIGIGMAVVLGLAFAQTPVPKDLSARHAIAAALAHHATSKNAGAFVKYLARIVDHGKTAREYSLLFWRMAGRRDKSLRKCAEYIAWATTNKDLLLDPDFS